MILFKRLFTHRNNNINSHLNRIIFTSKKRLTKRLVSRKVFSRNISLIRSQDKILELDNILYFAHVCSVFTTHIVCFVNGVSLFIFTQAAVSLIALDCVQICFLSAHFQTFFFFHTAYQNLPNRRTAGHTQVYKVMEAQIFGCFDRTGE